MAIFVSYSRHDEIVVKALATAFENVNEKVWFDHHLLGGDVWWTMILANIRKCSVFVLAMSDHSLASKACTLEWQYALDLNKPVVPVVVGRAIKPRPERLAELQFVPFLPDSATAGMEVLLATQHAARQAGPPPAKMPVDPPIPLPYLQVIGREIEAGCVTPEEQMNVVSQLRKAYYEETEDTERQEIVAILRALHEKGWRTAEVGREIQAFFIAAQAVAKEHDRLLGASGDPDPNRPSIWMPREQDVPVRLAGTDFDARTAFLDRAELIFDEMQCGKAGMTAQAAYQVDPDSNGDNPASPAADFSRAVDQLWPPASSDRWPSRFKGVGTSSSDDPDWPAPDPGPSGSATVSVDSETSSPATSSTSSTTSTTSTADPPTTVLAPAPPPTHWAIGSVALLLSIVFGAVTATRSTPHLGIFVASGTLGLAALIASIRVTRQSAADHAKAVRVSWWAVALGLVALTLAIVGIVQFSVAVPTTTV